MLRKSTYDAEARGIYLGGGARKNLSAELKLEDIVKVIR